MEETVSIVTDSLRHGRSTISTVQSLEVGPALITANQHIDAAVSCSLDASTLGNVSDLVLSDTLNNHYFLNRRLQCLGGLQLGLHFLTAPVLVN